MNQHTAHVARVAPIHTGSCPIKVAMSTKTFAGARVGTLEKIAANEHKHKDSPDHSSPLSLLGSICSAFPKDEITKIFPSYLKCTLFVAECSAKQSSTESCQLGPVWAQLETWRFTRWTVHANLEDSIRIHKIILMNVAVEFRQSLHTG